MSIISDIEDKIGRDHLSQWIARRIKPRSPLWFCIIDLIGRVDIPPSYKAYLLSELD